MAQAVFSGNSNYTLDLDGALVSQSGLTSTIYWRVVIHKRNTYGHRAWGNTGSQGSVDSHLGMLWRNGNMEYNFQNGANSGVFTIAEGTFNVQHRSDGNAEYALNCGFNLYALGQASINTGWRSLPRIQTASVPGAPIPKGFSDITMQEVRYHFQGTSDGGSPVREWQALFQDATVNGPQIAYASTGSSLLGTLLPGHMYNFWSRGRNDIGWGPWSAMSSARTMAGARIKQGGVWKEAVPYVKHNGVWKLAQPYSKVNGIWRKSL